MNKQYEFAVNSESKSEVKVFLTNGYIDPNYKSRRGYTE